MTRPRILGIALVASFALGGVSTATATAETPEVLPVPTESSPLHFTEEQPATEWVGEQKGALFECKSGTFAGVLTSATLGTGVFTFTGCKSPINGAKCNSLGDPAGTILIAAGIHIVTVLLPKGEPAPELMAGWLILLINRLHVECGAALLLLIGNSVLAEFTKLAGSGTKTKEATATFSDSKGIQAIKECLTPKALCSGRTFGLDDEAGEGDEKAGQASEDKLTFENEVAFDY
jgi:hypothetical protein